MRRIIFVFLILFICYPPTIIEGSIKNREEYEKTGKAFWEVNITQKKVAFTFDDGPHPVFTPQILDVLKKHDAKATFFLMGAHVVKYPDLVKRMDNEGHELGNHTFNHFYNKHNLLKEEIDKTSDIINKTVGFKPKLFRPVGGYYNDKIIETAIENDFLIILWSWHQDTEDWRNPGVDRIVNKVVSGIKGGDIILMHDAGGDRTQTVKALDEILTKLSEDNYQFVTVSELIELSGPK